MGQLLEIAKVFVQPCEKLISVVQNAIGKAYEPRHIKKMADARAYEISTVGQALRENSDIPIVYEKGDISFDTTDFEEFIKRTEKRLAYQELIKQKNIENVADQAYFILEEHPEVEDEPLDSDWILRFFNSVQDVGNEEMQKIWAQILAKEVLTPGTVSLRTLTILAQMTAKEAKLFEAFIPYVLHCPNTPSSMPDDFFIFSDIKLEEIANISFNEILLFEEIGLISANGMVQVCFDIAPKSSNYISHQNKRIIEIRNNGDSAYRLSRSAFTLTSAGRELLQSISCRVNVHYDLKDYVEKCKEIILTSEVIRNPLPSHIEVITR